MLCGLFLSGRVVQVSLFNALTCNNINTPNAMICNSSAVPPIIEV